MTDAATRQLLQYVNTAAGPTLWFADEHIDAAAAAAVQPQADLLAVSNRYDVVAALQARRVTTQLADFDTQPPSGLRRVAFRVAKEKALVHYVINRALELLPPGGELFLSGFKNEGAKTYLDKAAQRAGGSCRIERDGGALAGVIVRGAELGEPLPDQDYAALREVDFGDAGALWSKPGIFGWQKLDAGSAFLIEHLSAAWREPPQRVLDLGCGYGYLTVQAAQRWPDAEFLATDNNIAAVAACERNMRQRGIRGSAVADDCGAAIRGVRFEAILCNPPFHQGFDVEGELTQRFLQAARRRLSRGGRALFVVNQFIPLEQKAASLFGRVDTLARNRSFKLLVLEA